MLRQRSRRDVALLPRNRSGRLLLTLNRRGRLKKVK
jgi:hypothetical protein